AAAFVRPDRTALRAEHRPARVPRHALAEHDRPSALRESVREELPRRAAVAGAVDAETPADRDAVLGAFLGDNVGDVGVGGVERDREAEAARQAVPLEALPALAGVVGPVDAAVVLLPQ